MKKNIFFNPRLIFKKEISRFLVVGFSAVACDFLVYYLLINFLNHTPAKAISFLSGTALAYVFNKYWTFEKKEKSHKEMLRFLVLYLSTFVVNVAINQGVLNILAGYVFFAFLCATGTSTVLNFIGQKWWVFKTGDKTKVFNLIVLAMQKELPLRTAWFLFPALFLIFFQFFGSFFSVLKLSFNLLLSVSFLISILAAFILTVRLNKKFYITGQQITLGLLVLLFFSFLFLFRINWDPWDYICPTGLLGLVGEVSRGIFPTTFLSFPEFTMNYHQGFVFTAGVVSYVFGILPSISIRLTFITLFFLINLLIIIYFISIKSKYYFLPPILFLLISSITPKFFLDLGWYNYVSIFDQASSNSWPLAFLVVIVFLFFLEDYENSWKSILSVFFLILAVSTINATLFSVLVIGLFFLFLYQFIYLKNFDKRFLLLYLGLGFLLYFIPRHIPSAFLIGEYYDSPHYTIKFFEMGAIKWFKQTLRFFLLSGSITLLALALVFKDFKEKTKTIPALLATSLVASVCFSIVFFIKNIDLWDNINKFAIINIFFSIIICTVGLSKNMAPKKIIAGLVICFIISLPTLPDMFNGRFSMNFSNHLYPELAIDDIVGFLKKQPVVTLIPYNNDVDNMCSEVGFAAIAEHSGNYLRYSYFYNFLLNEDLEAQNEKLMNWGRESTSSLKMIANLKDNEYIIARKQDKEALAKLFDLVGDKKQGKVIEFNNYFLYH